MMDAETLEAAIRHISVLSTGILCGVVSILCTWYRSISFRKRNYDIGDPWLAPIIIGGLGFTGMLIYGVVKGPEDIARIIVYYQDNN